MKKGLIFVLFVLVSIVSYSQISWSAKAGMNMSNVTKMEDTKMKVGGYLGVGMEYQFTDMWSIQPSLLFSTKGYKEKKEEGDESAGKATPMYLELPVMAAARFAIADGQNIVVKAGAYFAFGLGGKYKDGDYKVDIFKDTKDEDGDIENEAAKRFDLGIGVGVTYEINKFFIDLTGSFGLTKLQDVGVEKYDAAIDDYTYEKKSAKNMNFSIGVGYKF